MSNYKSFKEFYPFYLSQHSHPTCRLLHVFGSLIIVLLLLSLLFTHAWWQLVLVPVIGYGFAWVGHFIFEKNKPATFTYPIYSFMGDWVMFWDIVRGKHKL